MNEVRAAKAGEKKLQILRTIAEMLERPEGVKVTTALLAKQLDVSEAALYRHFASKAQMYEGLIEFIESGMFSVISQIESKETTGLKQAEAIVGSLLRFAQKNRGLTRVLVGDALVHENPRLQLRINQLLDRIGATLKQCLKHAAVQGALPATHDFAAQADLLVCYTLGRWQRFVKSNFKDDPMAHWAVQSVMLLK
ncbi:MAG: nucleoid occlusion factor SlmA [Rhodocyclaceae bacterium]|nr:nucleoid occlusion factor SlmA [Rhodocyclaceae bacterium]MBK9624777.1 nucleoid occlusion factor SlmA [Rhodocyclaceae bacterium]MBL0077131.1 nucleoid occlusion factor SlmA [Rhodocyclaceae bacterium]MBP6280200.1 nucleoid occlusion factor SlmA [Rhodocyclaceae bacterium]